MSVLLGTNAITGLNAGVLGLTFCNIPAGTYTVGGSFYEDNPLRHVQVDAHELADTPTTNAQLRGALSALGGQNTVLMFESKRNRHFTIAARGTKEEIVGLEISALREVVAGLRSSGHLPEAATVDDVIVQRGMKSFMLEEETEITSVTLAPRLISGFDDDEQPALMSASESSAIAALFGLILMTGEMWEVAAGELGEKKYLDENKLRRVAHFYPAEPRSTDRVKQRQPNRFGLHDMLGNVWEAMANRYRDDQIYREFRGGSWNINSGYVRAALRFNVRPENWDGYVGSRFGRQDPVR